MIRPCHDKHGWKLLPVYFELQITKIVDNIFRIINVSACVQVQQTWFKTRSHKAALTLGLEITESRNDSVLERRLTTWYKYSSRAPGRKGGLSLHDSQNDALCKHNIDVKQNLKLFVSPRSHFSRKDFSLKFHFNSFSLARWEFFIIHLNTLLLCTTPDPCISDAMLSYHVRTTETWMIVAQYFSNIYLPLRFPVTRENKCETIKLAIRYNKLIKVKIVVALNQSANTMVQLPMHCNAVTGNKEVGSDI